MEVEGNDERLALLLAKLFVHQNELHLQRVPDHDVHLLQHDVVDGNRQPLWQRERNWIFVLCSLEEGLEAFSVLVVELVEHVAALQEVLALLGLLLAHLVERARPALFVLDVLELL